MNNDMTSLDASLFSTITAIYFFNGTGYPPLIDSSINDKITELKRLCDLSLIEPESPKSPSKILVKIINQINKKDIDSAINDLKLLGNNLLDPNSSYHDEEVNIYIEFLNDGLDEYFKAKK